MNSLQTELAMRTGHKSMSDRNVHDVVQENRSVWQSLGQFARTSQSGRDYLDAIERLEALRSTSDAGVGTPGYIDDKEGALIRQAMDQVQDARLAAAKNDVLVSDQVDFRGGLASHDELELRHERNAPYFEPKPTPPLAQEIAPYSAECREPAQALSSGRLTQRLIDGDDGGGLERLITKPLSWLTGRKLGTDEAALSEAMLSDPSTRRLIHEELRRSNPQLYPNGLKSYVADNIDSDSDLYPLYLENLKNLPDF
jgi:hypothetical protein